VNEVVHIVIWVSGFWVWYWWVSGRVLCDSLVNEMGGWGLCMILFEYLNMVLVS